ncbi:MAG: hypothetical protein GY694_00430 [Gammaproteobacteria bacterium]|nr:hypothetical protein [Gammaproteobacteria bacterium]
MKKFMKFLKNRESFNKKGKLKAKNKGSSKAKLLSIASDHLAKDRVRVWLHMGVMVGVTIVMSESVFAAQNQEVVQNATTFNGLVGAVLKSPAQAVNTYCPAAVGIGAAAGLAFNPGGLGEKAIASVKGCGWGLVSTFAIKAITTPFI